MAKTSGLGRGLGALLEDSDLGQNAHTGGGTGDSAESGGAGSELFINPSLLKPNPHQPRQEFDEEALKELADSIREHGIIQPIIAEDAGDGTYYIIAGERRTRAARLAGLSKVPVIIKKFSDGRKLEIALIENIQRENLNPVEEARALDRLIREFDMTHQTAADAVGRSRAAVSNLLRLLELAEEVKALVESRQLEMGHARALLGLAQARQQIEVALLVAKKGLSVRETEALVRKLSVTKPDTDDREPPRPDPNITRLEQDLTDKLGAKVHLQHGPKGRGKLVINYNSLDELDGILARIR